MKDAAHVTAADHDIGDVRVSLAVVDDDGQVQALGQVAGARRTPVAGVRAA